MTRTEIIALARMRLGFNNSLLNSYFLQVLDAVQASYETAEGRMPLPWFLFNSATTVPVLTSTRTAVAPTDFLAMDESWAPTILDGTAEYEIERKVQRDLAPFYGNVGRPQYYAFDGLLVHLYGLPDKAYTLKFPCYRRSAVLSLTETSLWFKHFPNLMLEELVVTMARNTRDEGAVKMSTLAKEQDNYRIQCESMRHQLMNYVWGGPDPIGDNDGS